jgi:hypothetical protein
MLPPLIVSSNRDWIQKIQEESKSMLPAVWATHSFAQAIEWIQNPEVSMSGIYLNPSDPSFSGIKFLGVTLIQRPATPTFIIDEEGGLTPRNVDCLADKFKIMKAFNGAVGFKEMIAPLQTQVPADLMTSVQSQKRSFVESKHKGYWAVPVMDFIHCRKYPFNVFVEDETNELRFFAMEEGEVDLDYLLFLSQKTQFLYLELATLKSRRDSVRFVEEAYLDPDYLSPSWRSAETLYRTKMLMDDLKKNGVNEAVIEQSYSMMEDLFKFMGQMSKDVYLQKFVDQAKASDRTVACATWSSLMCKKLKFETTAGLESLGLASFMQDVSLYNSPFGNISGTKPSELSSAAYEYYLTHPNVSAELMSKVKDVPELTRQIIRQHHERPDRTGFPGKIGGTQLQPLAEILSLINAYLDHDGPASQLDTEVFPHYSERFVKAFKEMLVALGKFK